jgi:hypothetical protein
MNSPKKVRKSSNMKPLPRDKGGFDHKQFSTEKISPSKVITNDEQDTQKPQLLVIGFDDDFSKPKGKMPEFGKKPVKKP